MAGPAWRRLHLIVTMTVIAAVVIGTIIIAVEAAAPAPKALGVLAKGHRVRQDIAVGEQLALEVELMTGITTKLKDSEQSRNDVSSMSVS